MVFANRESYISSPQFHMPSIYFSCLITVARNSETMLLKGCQSGHYCLVPSLGENTFTFSLLSKISAADFL